MIRRKVVSPISAFLREGDRIKRTHGFLIIRAGRSEQAERVALIEPFYSEAIPDANFRERATACVASTSGEGW
jgi:hypothetical protein